MERNYGLKIQEQMISLLWEDPKDRDDDAWAQDWRTLLAGKSFSLSEVSTSYFTRMWTTREPGEKEDKYIWQILASLERLRRTVPDCAGQILTEITGAWLIFKGIQAFGWELHRRKLYKEERGYRVLLREDESLETAAYLNCQEMRLIEAIRRLGFTFSQENYLWRFLKDIYPNLNLEYPLYFLGEFGKVWKQLAGRKIELDLADDCVCAHLEKVLRTMYSAKDIEQQAAYAFQEVGAFRNAEQKSKDIAKLVVKMDGKGIDEVRMLIQRGFYTGQELRQMARDAGTPDWILPVLILALHDCGMLEEEGKRW